MQWKPSSLYVPVIPVQHSLFLVLSWCEKFKQVMQTGLNHHTVFGSIMGQTNALVLKEYTLTTTSGCTLTAEKDRYPQNDG